MRSVEYVTQGHCLLICLIQVSLVQIDSQGAIELLQSIALLAHSKLVFFHHYLNGFLSPTMANMGNLVLSSKET